MTHQRRVTLPRLQVSCKGGLLYVLTVYPAESWAPRVRAHEFCQSVSLSVCPFFGAKCLGNEAR